MKKYILLVLLALLSCEFDYNKSIIHSKEKDESGNCKYIISGTWIEFIAPCDYYEIGDTINKYKIMAEQK